MKQKCKNCTWWKEFPMSVYNTGSCRLRPPVVMQTGGYSSSHDYDTVWPKTESSDFCGEWEGKPDAVPAS